MSASTFSERPMRRIGQLPFLVILTGVAGLSMLAPMALAVRLDDYFTARVFLQSGLLILVLTGLIAVASVNHRPRNDARRYLVALFQAFLLLPFPLALPLVFLIPEAGFFALWFEMLSSLTTTGATLFDRPTLLSEPIHLWRALVAWMGGLLMLVCAVAILAPLNLGGFEIGQGDGRRGAGGAARVTLDMSDRLVATLMRLGPVYLGVTALLALALLLAGERSFHAVVLAMSTLSTSGITGEAAGDGIGSGVVGEMLIFLFLIFAVTRASFTPGGLRALGRDHEFRLMAAFVIALPAFLFLRHWIGAYGSAAQNDLSAALSALWGAVFTTLSFLTTTGFVSLDWQAAENWSGLPAPQIVLIGLSVIGGGVATTAGGVKLLRIYALFKHGQRELQRLSFPHSVAGAGTRARRIRREGAYLAWMFFMLFAISTAVLLQALTLTGLSFEEAMAFAVSALSTTGPLAAAVLETGRDYADLNDAALALLGGAMVLGRLETLAIVALFNPDFWRA